VLERRDRQLRLRLVELLEDAMGGARARRWAERLMLARASRVAGGRTTACSTNRPPRVQAKPSTSNTRQSRSAHGAIRPPDGHRLRRR